MVAFSDEMFTHSAFENRHLVKCCLAVDRRIDARSLPDLVGKNKNKLNIARASLESFLLGTNVQRIIKRIACF
jgi:hypothetical protein